ncbi:Guanylylate cyclase-domain-containing protein [Chytriomyces sp. MP71]|nr:Guanylylate cyclase-domain-containing protein [Chytriomyces sp. MP71]
MLSHAAPFPSDYHAHSRDTRAVSASLPFELHEKGRAMPVVATWPKETGTLKCWKHVVEKKEKIKVPAVDCMHSSLETSGERGGDARREAPTHWEKQRLGSSPRRDASSSSSSASLSSSSSSPRRAVATLAAQLQPPPPPYSSRYAQGVHGIRGAAERDAVVDSSHSSHPPFECPHNHHNHIPADPADPASSTSSGSSNITANMHRHAFPQLWPSHTDAVAVVKANFTFGAAPSSHNQNLRVSVRVRDIRGSSSGGGGGASGPVFKRKSTLAFSQARTHYALHPHHPLSNHDSRALPLPVSHPHHAGSTSSAGSSTGSIAESGPNNINSIVRHRIKALAEQVPHISQPSQWDCGLACVSMVLKSLRLFSHSDPLDLRLFVHRDAVELGSVWTIDLAYLLKAFGVSDFTYYTTYIGVNFNYASKQFYKNAFLTDSRRIHSLFADAQDNGVRVVPLLLPLDDMKRFLMSGRYAILMLVNLSGVSCRVCRRKAIRTERLRRKNLWASRWQTVGLGWMCGAAEEEPDSDVDEDGLLQHSRHQDGYLFSDNADLIDNEPQSRFSRRRGSNYRGGNQANDRERRQRFVGFESGTSTSPSQNAVSPSSKAAAPSASKSASKSVTTVSDRTPLLLSNQHGSLQQGYDSVHVSVADSGSRSTTASTTPSTLANVRVPPTVEAMDAHSGATELRQQRHEVEHLQPWVPPLEMPEYESLDFSVIKTLSSTILWLGSFVFSAEDQDEAGTNAITPPMAAKRQGAGASNAGSAPVTPTPSSSSRTAKRLPPPGVQITIDDDDDDSTLREPSAAPRRAVPPGVGIVSKVDEETHHRLQLLNSGMRRASSANSSGNFIPPPMPPAATKSQPGSTSSSPMRISIFGNSIQQQQQQQQQPKLSTSISVNSSPVRRSGVSVAAGSPTPPSALMQSPTPPLLSFLTPGGKSPKKHRAFSIPGTETEMAAAAAAITRNRKTGLSNDGAIAVPAASAASSRRGVTFQDVPITARSSATATGAPAAGAAVSSSSSSSKRREEIFASKGVHVVPENVSSPVAVQPRRGSLSFWGGVLGGTSGSLPEAANTQSQETSSEDDDAFESMDEGSWHDEEEGEEESEVDEFWSDGFDDEAGDVDDESEGFDEGGRLESRRRGLRSRDSRSSCWSAFGGMGACFGGSGGSLSRSFSTEPLLMRQQQQLGAAPGAAGSHIAGNVFTRFFTRGAAPNSTNDLEQEEFVGHYILFIGYDAKTDGFIYRDPGTEERLCVMNGAAVEWARSGVPGSDHDVIVVRAGV